MVPLTQRSERSLGPWQTHEVVFAASTKKQLHVDVLHGRQHGVDYHCLFCILVKLGIQWWALTKPLAARILYLLCSYFLLWSGVQASGVWRIE